MAMANDRQQPIQLLQLTDSHLGESVGEKLLNLDTDDSLAAVLALINAQATSYDVLLATGDIANHASAPAYQRFQTLTQHLANTTLWLPGNHDDPAIMASAVGEPLQKTLSLGGWTIIMLDSTVRGQVGGALAATELAFLKQQLQAAGQQHVLVCLHHHPINSGCAWLDDQKVSNAEAFFACIDAYPQVKGVLWGHIHQQIDRQRHGVQLMASPSTCIQFAPQSKHFQLDHANPGFRTLSLHSDGRIETAVLRVTNRTFDIDFDDAEGY